MDILVLNCGSSSLKFTLYNMPDGQERVVGDVQRIGTGDAVATYLADGTRAESTLPDVDHGGAVSWVADQLRADSHTVAGIGHRVVHGGETYSDSVLITSEVERKVDSLSQLAPLHNPAHLLGIRSASAAFGDTPQVAVFDTAFHQTLSPHAYRYPLAAACYSEHGIRRYGFHGISHRYVSERAAEMLDKPTFTGVTCHLGNGSSLAAIQDGRSVDTTMGLTPLGGVPMGTRSGDLDPAIVIQLQRSLGLDSDQLEAMLNNESGLLGLSGVSNDLREIEASAAGGNTDAKLSIEVMVYQVAKAISGYLGLLDEADGVVFTGGIGENAVDVRGRIIGALKGLPVEIDLDRNRQCVSEESDISSVRSDHCVLVIPTREEYLIAQDTYRLVQEA